MKHEANRILLYNYYHHKFVTSSTSVVNESSQLSIFKEHTGGLSMEGESLHLTGNLAPARAGSEQQAMVLHHGEIHL